MENWVWGGCGIASQEASPDSKNPFLSSFFLTRTTKRYCGEGADTSFPSNLSSSLELSKCFCQQTWIDPGIAFC